jgi:hypothetical protein
MKLFMVICFASFVASVQTGDAGPKKKFCPDGLGPDAQQVADAAVRAIEAVLAGLNSTDNDERVRRDAEPSNDLHAMGKAGLNKLHNSMDNTLHSMDNAEPSNAEPNNAEPNNAEPSNAEPSNAEPSNAEPSDRTGKSLGIFKGIREMRNRVTPCGTLLNPSSFCNSEGEVVVQPAAQSTTPLAVVAPVVTTSTTQAPAVEAKPIVIKPTITEL